MTDPAPILAIVAILATLTIAAFAAQLRRLDASGPQRLVGELRLSQWAATLLAGAGAVPVGLALGAHAGPIGNADITIGIATLLAAGVVLQREPRGAVRLAMAAFVAHAVAAIAHRPGWLSPDVMPRGYATGAALFDVAVAALCYWGTRR